MLATNQIFLFTGIAFFIAAFAIWLAPKPARIVHAAGVH
jgi:DHA2 family multidrug resistance protein